MVGASYQPGERARVADVLLPQSQGDTGLSLLIKVDGKPFSHKYSELKKKKVLRLGVK